MNKYLAELSIRINKEANFEDVIVDRIKSRGYERAEFAFQAYAKFYRAVRDDLNNEDEIYSKYFKSNKIENEEKDISEEIAVNFENKKPNSNKSIGENKIKEGVKGFNEKYKDDFPLVKVIFIICIGFTLLTGLIFKNLSGFVFNLLFWLGVILWISLDENYKKKIEKMTGRIITSIRNNKLISDTILNLIIVIVILVVLSIPLGIIMSIIDWIKN